MAALMLLAGCGAEKAGSRERNYPEPASPGAQLLIDRCGSCHAAPEPSAHTRAEWPGIVHRMQQRMVSKAFKPLDEREVEVLTDYLQRHAGASP